MDLMHAMAATVCMNFPIVYSLNIFLIEFKYENVLEFYCLNECTK